MDKYGLLFRDNICGYVVVEQVGLYTKFHCVCEIREPLLLRVWAIYKDCSVDLGICLKEGERYHCTSIIATKRLGNSRPEFYVRKVTEEPEKYEILDLTRPFAQIQLLPYGYLTLDKGEVRISFRESISSDLSHPSKRS